MPIERINPPGLMKSPIYSHIIKTGNTYYIAGQISRDKDSKLVGLGDFRTQCEQVFENLKTALAAIGGTFENLVKVNIFMTEGRHYEIMKEVRARYIKDLLPTITVCVVQGLASPDLLIEIEGIAWID